MLKFRELGEFAKTEPVTAIIFTVIGFLLGLFVFAPMLGWR